MSEGKIKDPWLKALVYGLADLLGCHLHRYNNFIELIPFINMAGKRVHFAQFTCRCGRSIWILKEG